MVDRFNVFAKAAARASGHVMAFVAASLFILAWLVSGPLFGFSDTWQLVINTATTVVTFLMVFVIQSSQNRDTEAIHVKLNELLRAVRAADEGLADLEERAQEEREEVREHYLGLARKKQRQQEKP